MNEDVFFGEVLDEILSFGGLLLLFRISGASVNVVGKQSQHRLETGGEKS